ncbi:MAG TPA: hypothetical protein VJB66_00805 [Candidatus Nanoarchaeia archaeon]|nr:hypothetical protein [Candidatus Nanoarchaeia archaeon]
MAKLESLKDNKNQQFLESLKGSPQRDKENLEIVSRELDRFNKLIKGHEKLLKSIGEL